MTDPRDVATYVELLANLEAIAVSAMQPRAALAEVAVPTERSCGSQRTPDEVGAFANNLDLRLQACVGYRKRVAGGMTATG